MNKNFYVLLLVTILTLAGPAFGEPVPATKSLPDWPALQAELESMQKSDQTMRMEFTSMQIEARSKNVEVDKVASAALWKKINEADGINQKRVAEIIDTYGWPAKSRVGALAATTVFLVVQHADLPYQLKYIVHMREAVAGGEAAKQNLALLEDRVLIRQGKPQLYGSQVNTTGGTGLRPVEDPENLDKRRATMSLGPICEYLQYFVQQSGPIIYPPCVKDVAANK